MKGSVVVPNHHVMITDGFVLCLKRQTHVKQKIDHIIDTGCAYQLALAYSARFSAHHSRLDLNSLTVPFCQLDDNGYTD